MTPPATVTRPPAPAPCRSAATGAVWTGDIPVGGTVTITSTATVNNPDTGDHS